MIAASYWTALALGALAIFLHGRWYVVDKATGGEVVSGFGAALVVLGVMIGGRAYVRSGIIGVALQQTTTQALVITPSKYGGDMAAATAAARAERAAKVVPDLIAERVIAVAIVILGTLLNGYGPLIARLAHLRG